MKWRTFALFILLLFSVQLINAQDKRFIYYFDEKLNSTSREKAVINGVGTFDNGLVKVLCYSVNTKKLIVSAHFPDSSLRVYHGLFQTYHQNGVTESEGNFDEDKEDGVWNMWDSLGRKSDSTLYTKGKKLLRVKYFYHKDNSISNKIIEDNRANTLEKYFYNEKGKLTSEHSFIGNNGVIKNYSDTGIRTYTVDNRVEIEASFPGGSAAWNQFIKNIVIKNYPQLLKDGQSGTCIVKFIVDKEGNVKDPEATTMQGSLLAEVVVRGLRRAPKWIPANQYGRAVNAYRLQPVSFKIE